MAHATVNDGIELEYDTFGSPDDPALLLVMGFTAQLIAWREGFCRLLADGGRFVIRFDNRDCGLSTKFDGATVDVAAVMGAAFKGEAMPAVPYTLSDMAADAVGLLDHLGVELADVLGMIAQTIAIEYPERTRSLISVMSQTGELDVGQSTPEASAALLAPPPTDRDAFIDAAAKAMVWQSKKYGDAAKVRDQAAIAFDRSFYPEGAPRQLAAVYAGGSRVDNLSVLDVPTLVIHGRDDTLITPSGGERTAEVIPGANLFLVADMGHDMPEQLWPILTDVILAHVRNAG